MFKKNEVVIYPSHGRSIVNRVYNEKNGEKYYELLYVENLTILIPVEKAENFGMRYPIGKNSLIKLLKNSNDVKIHEEDFLHIHKIATERFSTGKIDDLIYLIKLLETLSDLKIEKKKKLEINERQYLEQARELLNSESEYVLGEKSYEKLRI